MKRLVCVILSAALLFCLSSCGQKPKMRREIDNSKLLRVSEDGYLTDGSDNGIQLRGVNFGGWLLQETWMCPVMSLDRSLTVKGGTDDGWAELDTLNKFTLLFGEEKTAELFKSYYWQAVHANNNIMVKLNRMFFLLLIVRCLYFAY